MGFAAIRVRIADSVAVSMASAFASGSPIFGDISRISTVSMGTLTLSTMVAAEPRPDRATRKSASASFFTVLFSSPSMLVPGNVISWVDTDLSVQMRPMSLVVR